MSWISAISYALPGWWTGILLILVFGFALRVLPTGGMFSTPPPTDPLGRFLDLLYHAILPILTLVLVSLGPVGLRDAHDDDDRRPGGPRHARTRQGHG